jgi:uncharacterized Zn finger protein
MSTLPKVTEKTIRSRVGDRSFAAGESYFRGGAVFNARRQGRTLKARCQGSRDAAYQAEVTFDDKGIAEAECSCPVGDGGHCKHVAAVLLNWRSRPKDFAELEELDVTLERRSKAELIALVKQLLRREPDLELLLEAPVPGTRSPTADVETYRRQAKAAFRNTGYGPGAADGIADELFVIKETGDHLLKEKDYTGAAAVYEGIASVLAEDYDVGRDEYDEENALGQVVDACVEGLGKCLKGLKEDPARREVILRAVWDLYRLDTEQGGLGMADTAPELLLEDTTPEERRTIAAWVRASLPRGKEGRDSWEQREYGGLLLDLEAETLDDESFLRVCRETGRTLDLVDRLLRLRRLPEAVAEAERASDWDLLNMADVFVRHRHAEEAERLVQERSQKSQDYRLLEWLKKRAAARKDVAAVLELTEQLFRRMPSLPAYRELRALAKKHRRWKDLEPELLAFLKQSHSGDVLVRVYLDEGAIDEALEAVRGVREYAYGSYGLKLEVARAAEKTRPRAALEIYRAQAEGLIGGRHRESYRSACQFLKKVRDLYRRLGEDEAWASYAARLRHRHGSLRALLDEMKKARL